MTISQETLKVLEKELGLTKEVKQTKFPKEEKKLMDMLADLPDLLEATGAMIAGGAITSLFTNREINDFDVYFRDKESFSKFMAGVFSSEWGYWTMVHHTNRSILMTNHAQAKVQLIVYKFFPEVKDVFNDFDFSINMGAYDFKIGEFVFHEDFLKHNSQRYIDINTNTAYPLISMLRVDKYREKGYKVSKAQVLRLLFKVSALKMNSWEEALDQVGGMYGVDPEKIFDKTKPYSIEAAISQLSSVASIEGTWKETRPTLRELGDAFKNILTEDVYNAMMSRSWSTNWLDFLDEGQSTTESKLTKASSAIPISPSLFSL